MKIISDHVRIEPDCNYIFNDFGNEREIRYRSKIVEYFWIKDDLLDKRNQNGFF